MGKWQKRNDNTRDRSVGVEMLRQEELCKREVALI